MGQEKAEAKPKVQAAVGDKTVSILQPYAKGIYAFGHNFGRGGDILYIRRLYTVQTFGKACR